MELMKAKDAMVSGNEQKKKGQERKMKWKKIQGHWSEKKTLRKKIKSFIHLCLFFVYGKFVNSHKHWTHYWFNNFWLI